MTTPDTAARRGPATTFTPLTSTTPRWTDVSWLDALRAYGDKPADRCAAALKASGVPSAVTRGVLETMKRNDRRLPADAPEPLREFFDATYSFCDGCGTPRLPAWVDRDRILRGQQMFMTRSLPAVLVMLCKSLPEGYAAPSMAKILNLSGQLKAKPYHRLMGTLQLLTDVTTPYSFERMGLAGIAGQEMRLLHAGVRTNVSPITMGSHEYDKFVRAYGTPINQEDMAGTIIGFSLLVVDGLETLGLALEPQAAEDYYYVWRVFAHLMGVRAPGVPDDADSMPQSLAEARAFYQVYQRHYVGPTDYSRGWRERAIAANRDGVELAEAHVHMLGRFISGQYLKHQAEDTHNHEKMSVGGRMTEEAAQYIARKYVHMLIGDAAAARIGVPQTLKKSFLSSLLEKAPAVWERLWDRTDKGVHMEASEWLFRRLVTGTYQEGVSFPVPLTVRDLYELADHGD